MVTPDYTRHQQDVAPGLVRDLHETIGTKDNVFHNLVDVDYDAIVSRPRFLSTQCDDGYVVGLPYGRHLRVFYEFDVIDAVRQHLPRLLNELGELAMQHSDAEIMVLEFNDFPRRHAAHPAMQGAEFEEPTEVMVARCNDIREVELPELADGVSVREAKAADADTIAEIEEAASGESAMAPPLPDDFFSDALWVGLAEANGEAAGFIRVLDGPERRSLAMEEFVIHPDQDAPPVSAALLRGAIERAREDDVRRLSLRVATEAFSDPLLQALDFRHVGDSVIYQRPADPAEVQRLHDEKITTRVRVGKIFGRF